jgi:hypothetical protein
MAKKNGKGCVLCAALITLLIAAVFCGCDGTEPDKTTKNLLL